MHSTFKITDASASNNMASSETTQEENLLKKKGCPHYQPEWDTHSFCRLCRSRRSKGIKYCNWDDPCEVCSSWPPETWQKSDDSLKKKLAKDVKKDRSRSTSDSSKSVSVPKEKVIKKLTESKKQEIGLSATDEVAPARPISPIPTKIPPPPPLKIAPSVLSGRSVQVNEGNSSKRPDRDRGSDLPSLFAHRSIYKPKTVNITPVPSDHESEEDDDPVKSPAILRQSRFDKFEAERQFKHELELAKLASLGIESAKNKVTTSIPMKGSVLATKRQRSPSISFKDYKIPKKSEDMTFQLIVTEYMKDSMETISSLSQAVKAPHETKNKTPVTSFTRLEPRFFPEVDSFGKLLPGHLLITSIVT